MKLFLQTKNGADGLAMIGAMAELGLDMTALADVLASSGLPCHIETQKSQGEVCREPLLAYSPALWRLWIFRPLGIFLSGPRWRIPSGEALSEA